MNLGWESVVLVAGPIGPTIVDLSMAGPIGPRRAGPSMVGYSMTGPSMAGPSMVGPSTTILIVYSLPCIDVCGHRAG